MFDAPRHRSITERVVVTAACTWGPLGLREASSTEYLQPGVPPVRGPADIPLGMLDGDKTRRFDGAAMGLSLIAKTAFDAANAQAIAPERIGIVAGLALRGGDVGATFLAPVLESNFRTGKPIIFPGLLPSSPTSQASIYLSLRGPSMTAVDREASAAAALSEGIDLLVQEHAEAMIVGGLSEWDELTWEVVGPVCFGSSAWPEPSTDGAGALVLEREGFALARGARVLAVVVARQSDAGPSLSGIAAPRNVDRALVVAARDDERLDRALAGSAWEKMRRVGLSARAGAHEALDAMALAAAAQAIATKEADEVLVVAVTDGRLEAVLLGQPGIDSLMIEKTAPQGSATTAIRP